MRSTNSASGSNGVSSAVEHGQRRAVAERELREGGRRVDAEGGADGEEHVGAGGGALRPLEVAGDEILAEGDGGRLQHAAALEAGRVLVTGAHPGERVVHRAPPPADEALGLVHGAMDLDHDLGRRAGRLVQAVDVLGDDRVQVRPAFELGQRDVPGVRLAPEQLTAGPVAPHLTAVLGVVHVVLDGRLALGRRVLGPEALRAAEVGDARLGRDPGAREDDDLLGLAQERGEAVELRVVGHGRTVPGCATRQPRRAPAGAVHEAIAREQRVPGTGTRRSAADARIGGEGRAA